VRVWPSLVLLLLLARCDAYGDLHIDVLDESGEKICDYDFLYKWDTRSEFFDWTVACPEKAIDIRDPISLKEEVPNNAEVIIKKSGYQDFNGTLDNSPEKVIVSLNPISSSNSTPP